MPEENQNQKPIQAPEQADPKYKETLLLYNEQNGAVEAVSDLKQSGNQYKVTTTQPLTANKPAFYELRNSSAVAAFIKGFMSQENAKPFHFLKVAADKASEVTQSLLRLADNPKDPEGLKALYDHRVTSYQLEKVKFDTPDLKLQELKEMGIIVTPKELEAMKHGLPTTDLHDVTLKIGNIPVAGQFALHPYKDMNGDVQVGLTSALPRPEFEREEYRMMFSTSEKEQLLAGKTPDRLSPFRKTKFPICVISTACVWMIRSRTNWLWAAASSSKAAPCAAATSPIQAKWASMSSRTNTR